MNQHLWTSNPLFDLYHQYQQLGQAFTRIQQQNNSLQQSLNQQVSIQQQLLARQQNQSPTTAQTQNIQEKIQKKTKRSIVKKKKQDRLNRPEPYDCPYENCTRIYKSSIALNLHIKTNHNGGTKKERQAYAKKLIDSEKGLCPQPEPTYNLPPNFLSEFRNTYTYTQKYNM